MPSVTGKLDDRRIIIDVGIQPIAQAGQAAQQFATFPILPITPFRGLLDTGAQITCVTKKAAAAAGLKPRGKKRIGNVSSIEMHDAYSFVLGVWYTDNSNDVMNQTKGYFAFDAVLGADFKDNDDFDILIGMDIITQGTLTVTKHGDFTWVLG